MIRIIHALEDEVLASRIQADLRAAGLAGDIASEICLVIVSEAALRDAHVQTALEHALDHQLQILPLRLEAAGLPALIDHLEAVDLTSGYASKPVEDAVRALMQRAGRLPLRVRTSAVRRANNLTGLVIGLVVLAMFAIGLFAVAVLNVEAPVEEFNAIDTEVAATRDFLIAPTLDGYLRFLPGSAEEASVYPATVQAVPTRIRPFVAATATAVAVEQQDE